MKALFSFLVATLSFQSIEMFAQSSNASSSTSTNLLWQIGSRDNDDREFALAPGGWAKFTNDAFFVVGESDPKNDWPYVQPGPDDSWAGSRQHTFCIIFGLKSTPVPGECRLQVHLVDTHRYGPPKLEIQINGRHFERTLRNGATDASLQGHPEQGRPSEFELAFDAGLLRPGNNDIEITTLSGSWMVYDWLGLSTPSGTELATSAMRTVITRVQPVTALREEGVRQVQPMFVSLRHFGDSEEASLRLENSQPQSFQLQKGEQTVELAVPAVTQPTESKLVMTIGGQELAARTVTLEPVPKLTVYVLPHSHTDIGYTEIQSDVEKKQMNNLLEGIEAARRTADYPEGARFVWNVEVLYAADLFLHRFNEQQKADFFGAVKKGQVALNGMYLNELTGLCRPEELLRLFRCATRISQESGVPIRSAMISDVPGYTWGTVEAMAQAGIKYFSMAPNYFDRIGTIMRDLENKPFYWVGPDGKSKVLAWIPFEGYAMSHIHHEMSPRWVEALCAAYRKANYPYEIAYVRWSGHGDNAHPDPAICEFIKDWNAKYTSPRFIISGTTEAFQAFEKRYGENLPSMHGDWTPYWEDGAGSSALETALNRQSSDRLVQAGSLYSMLNRDGYEPGAFDSAWKNVLLYSEHTWGAWCSITEPERKETKEQWAVKQGYAREADKESHQLLEGALRCRDSAPKTSTRIEVINTLSWPRTELATVPSDMAAKGDEVSDENGYPVPSQRLTSGELVFLAHDVPPLASSRYKLGSGAPQLEGRATAHGAVIENGVIHATVDEKTGAIIELTERAMKINFVDTSRGEGLNDYLYFLGDDLNGLQRNGPVRISVGEPGPLVASLVIESDAPGCNKLRRELRLVAGQDYLEIIDLVDKARLQSKDYKSPQGKESLNFAFPFNVADGKLLVDLPLGAMQPEKEQIPSACKNWLTVGRWVDLSNQERGITWVTLDAPLIEIGGLTARLLNSQTDPDVWRKHIEPTQHFYCWAMNNHWGTNYRAYQDGPVVFRFVLRPHRKSDPAEASRFAIGFSQPLLARRTAALNSERASLRPLFQVEPEDVLVSALYPSEDGKALMVRLYGASGKTRSASLHWGNDKPKAVFVSDTSEKPLEKLKHTTPVPGYGVVTLRAEMD